MHACRCPECRQIIDAHDEACPHCRASMNKYDDRRWRGVAVLVLVVGCVLTAVLGWIRKENAAAQAQGLAEAHLPGLETPHVAPLAAPQVAMPKADTATPDVGTRVRERSRTPEPRNRSHTGQNLARTALNDTAEALARARQIAETRR